jgi:acetyl esterase/lipase
MQPLSLRWLIPLALVVLLLPSCGDTGDDSADTTLAPTTTTMTAAPTTTTAASLADAAAALAEAKAKTSSTTTAATTTTADVLQMALSLSYTVDGSTQLDVFAPSEPGPWPVVIVIHGGYLDRETTESLAKAIASEGAVVFNVGVTMRPPFPEATEQVACAVRFAKATAADYGGDATEITLVGHSAGAVTGMVVAMTGDDYAQDCVVTDETAVLDVLVGYEGPYDWAFHDYGQGSPFPLGEEDPDQWEAINPYAHIGGNPDLVVRLIHGDDLDVAWYETPRDVSVDFNQVLLEAGYDAELTLLEGASHGSLLSLGSEAFDVTVQQALQVARG